MTASPPTTANHSVKAAIGQVGTTYIDSIARDPNDPAALGYQTELPDGTRVPGFDLDPATRANFLKFMAASDLGSNGNTPDSTIYGHFREAALERGSYYLQKAIHNNHGKIDPNDPAYQAAMRQAIGLTSATDGAAAGVLIDGAKEGSSNDQTALHAQQLAYEKAMSDYNVKKGYVDDVNLAMSAAGLIPGAGTATGAGSLIFGQITDAAVQQPSAPDTEPYLENIQGYVGDLADAQAAESGAEAHGRSNMVTMLTSASAAVGSPIVGDDGRPIEANASGNYSNADIARVVNNYADGYDAHDLGEDTVRQTVSTQNDASGHGGGYGTEFGDETGSGPAARGALDDTFGNWSNKDDEYRIYYGNETRYGRHDGGFWHGDSVGSEAPGSDHGVGDPLIPA